MDRANMHGVNSALNTLPQSRRRQRRLERAIEARRRLADTADAPRLGGRAWINGEEVGGADPRFAHLTASHD
jgi:hypothetical protein